ncbi:MAG: HPr family phosphocarrier protein [Clostridia bacterium]|nr:HPr family phosphocarrier protein [Clostridia bacterium]
MKEFTYTITDELGIHARPAGLLVKEAGKYNSRVTIECNGKSADGKKIFSVMSLGVKCGNTLTVKLEGDDEVEASMGMEEFFKKNL